MAQNSQPLELAEALARLFKTIAVIDKTETVSIRAARGRYLAQPITAPLALPPFPASAMDGYAVAYDAWQTSSAARFTVVGESRAGHPWQGRISGRECVRIFTGARVPDGADQILLQEEVRSHEGAAVEFNPHDPGESYVRPVGHDVHAGDPLAERGEYLHPMLLGSLASAGIETVEVYGKPTVGVFSTGDELVDPGTPPTALADGQIYDSNRLAVIELLAALPVEVIDLGRLADDEDTVVAALQEGAARCDVLLTSGGVSVGDADFITKTIAELGTLSFWRLNLKPGKPLAFGRIDDCLIFGLPGNPVSTIVTFLLVAKAAIRHLCGAARHEQPFVPARLEAPVRHSPGRAEYQRGVAAFTEKGLVVSGTGDQSSNRLSTFRQANCLIEVPGPAADLPAGAEVRVLLFEGLLS